MEIAALSLLRIVTGLRCMKVDPFQISSGRVILFKSAFPVPVLLGLRVFIRRHLVQWEKARTGKVFALTGTMKCPVRHSGSILESVAKKSHKLILSDDH
jgi:hypothetical protein